MRKVLLTLLLACFFMTGYAQTNVIDIELQEILNSSDDDDMISVNIIMKSQLTPSLLRDKTNDVFDKSLRRDVVVTELKSFAEKSQNDVMAIIKSEEMRNNASAIKSHWLSNAITCTITKEMIHLLSAHDDVALIGHNVDKYVLWDEDGEIAEVTRASIAENVTQVNAPEVWAQGYTGKGVVVAVLDSGVNYNHADVADHLWDGGSQYPNHGYNAYDDNNDPMDYRSGHGSHCAGTACGDGTSGIKTGIAPDATLMCVKVISDYGEANLNSICSGMEFAVEQGADVLSMSLGISNSSVTERTMLRQTCVNALESGVVAAVAVGNEGESLGSYPVPNNVRVPGSCPPPWIHADQQANAGGRSCVVAVGAVDDKDKYAALSSQGPVTWSNTSYGDYPYNPGIGLIRPDVCAPGKGVVSLNYSTNNEYTTMSGTSMATPCVAGVMCLMLSRNPELTPEEICEILETSGEKLSESKNNKTGSCRVDALAAVNAVDMGGMTLKDFSIDDSKGNDNASANPGETVSLNIDFENTSSQSYNNVTAILECDNNLINITKYEANIGTIAANATFSVNDKFEFAVSAEAKSKETLYFDVVFYSGDDKIATTRIILPVYDNNLQYAELLVENDDNGNGLLEAGETADLGVVINNVGNEIAVELSGILSSNSNLITINNDEALFGSVGIDASVTAYFNVTLSANAPSELDLSFEMEAKDKYGRYYDFDMAYVGKCNIVYELYDEYGDGWTNAKITAVYSDGSPSDIYTLANGSYGIYTKSLNTGVEVVLEWKKGAMDAECSYDITYENGASIYSGQGTKPKGEFFRWVNNCSCLNKSINTCDPVKNLIVTQGNNAVYLSWESPDAEVSLYEIYRDTKLIGTTDLLSFVDSELYANGKYFYNVRAVYEDCNGALTGEEIEFSLGTKEMEDIKVAVYPNPSNDKFIVRCDDMTNIDVFNIMGEKIMSIDTDNDIYEINGLDAGIYFFNVKSDTGTTIRKVVKY